jgi:hypothetical protein
MSLIMAEGFELHAAGPTLAGLFLVSGVPTMSTGRGGVGASVLLGTGQSLDYVLPAANLEVWVSVAVKDNTDFAHTVIGFYNASGELFNVYQNNGGQLEVRRGSTILGTSTSTWGKASFESFQVKVKFDDAAGTVQLRAKGAQTLEIDLTGQDTADVALGSGCTYVRLHDQTNQATYFTELVIGDASGSNNNDCPPELRVVLVPPTGDTVDADFTPTPGAGDNYEEVDEAPNDGDTTRNDSSTSGHKDRLTHSSVPSGVSIRGVVVSTIAKGGGNLRHVLTGSAGTEEDNGADIGTNASNYQAQSSAWETDPDTGSLWSLAGFQDADMSFGYKVA